MEGDVEGAGAQVRALPRGIQIAEALRGAGQKAEITSVEETE